MYIKYIELATVTAWRRTYPIFQFNKDYNKIFAVDVMYARS